MVNIQEFLEKDKSMIIAPAGYGKTHTIVDCVEQYEGEKKILILTHTHAGVSSIKDKIKKRNILNNLYHIETICSFALNLAKNYHLNKADFPLVENGREYFDFAIASSIKIVQNNAVKSVIRSRYSHLIVDEYQDCSIEQHDFILQLSMELKTHILGDPLQGIFNFRGTTLVDLESNDTLNDYRENSQELTTPWRWENNNASDLGTDLANIRVKLIAGERIDLHTYNSIEVITAPANDIYNPLSLYKNRISQEVNSLDNNVLIIHPISTSEEPRENILKNFLGLRMIESIDNRLFYDYSKEFDLKTGDDLILSIINFALRFSKKTEIEKWFKIENGTWRCIPKRNLEQKQLSEAIKNDVEELAKEKSNAKISTIIKALLKLPNNRFRRRELVFDVLKALNEADLHNISVYDAMKQNRDRVRREGRKIIGKCIGTTLLTKGLECDTVIVLDAHKFTDRKNLYVALTRACKKLIVITENATLNPY